MADAKKDESTKSVQVEALVRKYHFCCCRPAIAMECPTPYADLLLPDLVTIVRYSHAPQDEHNTDTPFFDHRW